ncbi:leucine rich repeat protein [Clostridium sp. MSTE9]|uniref:leucine-rich repeat protein n=1 Tax=Clostridium sp. (strain MSTE9) TaxID=1105031 RepID=UPI00026F4167|nr:leucine-rich repeat protein [Clostridium sp. MSTE9]EJF39687.1 leucine rich repeat protein [Clostridium sp. MSTE9]
MKEWLFRPLSVFLAAAMAIGIVQTGALPVYALGEEGTNSATQTENSGFYSLKATIDDTSGQCGENLTYDFDISNSTLTINGTGDMYYFGVSPWDNLNVTTVKIEEGATSIGVGAFSFCHSLTSITIPDSVTVIGSQAFRDCTNLTNIAIPSMVTSINDEAFYGCENLTNITIPSNASSIGNEVFGGCTKLESINVDNSNASFISSDGLLFNRNKTMLLAFPGGKKGSYAIPNSVNEVGAYAFSRCDNLTNVTIPDSVISIGEHAFFGTSLTNVLIPFSVTSIGTGAFASSFDLTSIDVAQDSKDYISADGVLFNKAKTELLCFPVGKSYLFENGKYTIPSSVTKIGEEAFSQCLLDDVTIPSNVTEIGNSAFEFTTNLTSVTIPKSVTNIGDNAFWDCKELTDVYYDGTQEDWNKISIGKYNDSLVDATMHYNGSSNPQPTTKYTVTVDGGTATSEQAAKNATVSIEADEAPNGQIFDKWTSNDGVTFANANSASTTFKMPEKNVTVTATYKDLPDGTYTVTVVNGGVEVTNGIVTTTSAAVSATVKIKANSAPSGKTFDKWTSADGITFANTTKAETTFEMPERNVTVTANYKSTGGSSSGGGSKGGSSGSGKAPTQQPSGSTTTSTTVTSDGMQVNISAPAGTANIPADLSAIMAARASGQNVSFTVQNPQTAQPAYTWSFNGTQLAQATQIGNLNLAITVVPTASVLEVQSAVAGNSGIVLRFANNGQLPAPATITVNAKDQGYQPGQVLYFYYLNPTTGKLEIQNNGQPIIVNTQGYAAVIVTHNSDFVLLPAKISSAGSLALDTLSYTIPKGKSYEIGAKLVGEGATLKVTSSRNGIAKVEQTKSGNYKVTALKDGITYVSFDVAVGGKVVSHSSVKITVQNGKAQGVSTRRVLNF